MNKRASPLSVDDGQPALPRRPAAGRRRGEV